VLIYYQLCIDDIRTTSLLFSVVMALTRSASSSYDTFSESVQLHDTEVQPQIQQQVPTIPNTGPVTF